MRQMPISKMNLQRNNNLFNEKPCSTEQGFCFGFKFLFCCSKGAWLFPFLSWLFFLFHRQNFCRAEKDLILVVRKSAGQKFFIFHCQKICRAEKKINSCCQKFCWAKLFLIFNENYQRKPARYFSFCRSQPIFCPCGRFFHKILSRWRAFRSVFSFWETLAQIDGAFIGSIALFCLAVAGRLAVFV